MTDQMIERAVVALGHDDDCPGDCTALTPHCDIWPGLAVMLDAAMPLVDNVKALNALPVGSQFLDRSGVAWGIHENRKHPRHYRRTTGEWVMTSERMGRLGPLRVIWTPEATK